MKKHVLKKIIQNLLPVYQKDEIVKTYSRQSLSRASRQVRKLFCYLNFSMSADEFNYFYENIHDRYPFIKIVRD